MNNKTITAIQQQLETFKTKPKPRMLLEFSDFQDIHMEDPIKRQEIQEAKEETKEEDVCCICLEEFTENNYVILECGHRIHLTPCYNDFINTSNGYNNRQRLCPMCRAPIRVHIDQMLHQERPNLVNENNRFRQEIRRLNRISQIQSNRIVRFEQRPAAAPIQRPVVRVDENVHNYNVINVTLSQRRIIASMRSLTIRNGTSNHRPRTIRARIGDLYNHQYVAQTITNNIRILVRLNVLAGDGIRYHLVRG